MTDDEAPDRIGLHRRAQPDDGKPTYVIHWHPRHLQPRHLDDLVDGFKRTASILRRRRFKATAYDLWRLSPWRNPKNQAAGSVGGTTAVANMSREERQARARKGGVMAMHGCEEGDGVRASARGRLLARRRWGNGRL